MRPGNFKNSLGSWIEELQAKGKISFTLELIKTQFPTQSEESIKLSLNRLTKKGKVLSIFKGFYLIIPPQYAVRGILPPAIYIDGLMKFLQRPYYVGLLNAAAFHGAAHQQPQEFFVVTSIPALRATVRKGIKVNYISKTNISESLIESRKTETGYLQISSPELTAADLIQFEKRIGGLGRAATVLSELVEKMRPEGFSSAWFESVPAFTVQRLGYILEIILKQNSLADSLYIQTGLNGTNFYRIPLKYTQKVNGHSSDNRWKIIVNAKIETEE